MTDKLKFVDCEGNDVTVEVVYQELSQATFRWDEIDKSRFDYLLLHCPWKGMGVQWYRQVLRIVEGKS